MKKIVQINTSCGVGSTGKIAVSISELLTESRIENYILFSAATNGYDKGIQCCSPAYQKKQAGKAKILGNYGFNSHAETRRMIEALDRISPDIVLLHNIHGHDCNLSMLFNYFKRKHIKLFWTFHDCWTFTGYCTHFSVLKCERWKEQCGNCPQRKQYSLFLDRSEELFKEKRRLFSGLDLTIITPSQWLADLVKQSFLKDYSVKVIHNGIDLSVFKPTESDFRKKHQIKDNQCVLLGVAFGWGQRKGLDVFIRLAEKLDGEKYKIVLVGTDENTDRLLPEQILSIHRTQNQTELAEIYSAADLFLNPTREDNFPTVNLESLACGTPVITFNTGGSPECIDESCGLVIDQDNMEQLQEAIEASIREHVFQSADCVKKARTYEKSKCFKEYINLLT